MPASWFHPVGIYKVLARLWDRLPDVSGKLFLTFTLDPKNYANEETAFEDSREWLRKVFFQLRHGVKHEGKTYTINTYADSIEPVNVRGPRRSHLSRLARDPIQRHAAVQKLCQFTHTRSIQVEGGCRVVPCGTPRFQFFADVRLGRRRQISYSFSSYVFGEVTEPGAAASLKLAPPAVGLLASGTAGDRAQSKRRSSPAPNTDPRYFGVIAFGR